MTPDKLGIFVDSVNPESPLVEAQFNPNELRIQHSASLPRTPTQGTKTPVAQHTQSNASTLTIDLFFDTYESKASVRVPLDKLSALIQPEAANESPPLCRLSWGTNVDFFKGYLRSINIRYALFLSDGTPVRATAACSFEQAQSRDENQRDAAQTATSTTETHVAASGESLSSIAGEFLGDPTAWRVIAIANNIDNPLDLPPGVELLIPSS